MFTKPFYVNHNSTTEIIHETTGVVIQFNTQKYTYVNLRKTTQFSNLLYNFVKPLKT